MSDYAEFLASRSQHNTGDGFEPLDMPGFLFEFQTMLVDWAIRQGRGALFADCGMGKTPMELVWADNVHRHTGKPVHDWGQGDCSSLEVPDMVKVAVLTEELGEVARAVLESDPESLRGELVQLAAVAVAWLEAL